MCGFDTMMIFFLKPFKDAQISEGSNLFLDLHWRKSSFIVSEC